MNTLTTGKPLPERAAGAPFSIREAAAFLGVSEKHIRRMKDGGKLRCIRIGARVLVPDSEVRRLAEFGADQPTEGNGDGVSIN